MRPPRIVVAFVLLAVASCAHVKDEAVRGFVVVTNAHVWGHKDVTTVLIDERSGTIVDVGEASIGQNVGAARVIDAGGGTVVPGFHDAHIHMLSGGRGLAQAHLDDATTLDATLAKVKQWADAHPDAPWILGRGWSYDIVPKGTWPTAKMLDAVTGDRPAALSAYDGHTEWLNSKAMQLAKITRETAVDGVVKVDGEPTGALLEDAEELVSPVIPELTRAQKTEALLTAAKQCAALGITGVDAIEAGADEWDILTELDRNGALPIRVNVILPIDGDMDAYAKLREHGTAHVKLIGVKGFVDGVVESKTAFMLAPYESSTETGKTLIPREKLYEYVDNATKHGFMVALHSIGDAAVRLSLDAYEHTPGSRGRIEHIEVLDAADVPRFKRIGAIASMQPYHAIPSDPDPDAGAWSENLGAARRKMTFAWRTLEDAGATLTFGSDWPVFTNDPLQGLAVATTRQNELGHPAGGWNAHQKVTMDDAIRAYSEGRTIDVGQPADLVVLPPEANLEAPATLWGKHPTAVLVAGHVVP